MIYSSRQGLDLLDLGFSPTLRDDSLFTCFVCLEVGKNNS